MIQNIPFYDLKAINSSYLDSFHESLKRVVSSGIHMIGKETENFEKSFAKYCGAKYCVGVGNGLDALILSLRAYIELGFMNEGDEVIVPANTYIATILAISESRLKPVLVEPDIKTFNINHDLIERAITSKTKAIMVVHLYGQTVDIDAIKTINYLMQNFYNIDNFLEEGLFFYTRQELQQGEYCLLKARNLTIL